MLQLAATEEVALFDEVDSVADFFPELVRQLRTTAPDIFSTWLGSLKCEEIENGTVHLSLATPFLAGWVGDHYRDTLLQACVAVSPDVTCVEFTGRVLVPPPAPPPSEPALSVALPEVAQTVEQEEATEPIKGTEEGPAVEEAAPQPPLPKRILIEDVLNEVCAWFELKRREILPGRRFHRVVRPRQIAMYLAKQHTNLSFYDIGRRMGGFDHSTVIHGVKKVESLMRWNDSLKVTVEALEAKLLSL